MRLFIAINFSNHVHRFLGEQRNRIKTVCTKGSFSKEENLHFTLIFLGEIPEKDLPTIITIIDGIEASPFPITFSGLGHFKRRDGDIWWMGILPNLPLQTLQRNLYATLIKEGFNLDSRPFSPHITLARGVRLHHQVESTTHTLTAPVTRISLMQTIQTAGRLSYVELHSKNISATS